MTVFVSVADVDLLLALIFLPETPLILVIEVHNVEWMFKVNEEIARILLSVIFCSCKIYACILIFVRLIDFLF